MMEDSKLDISETSLNSSSNIDDNNNNESLNISKNDDDDDLSLVIHTDQVLVQETVVEISIEKDLPVVVDSNEKKNNVNSATADVDKSNNSAFILNIEENLIESKYNDCIDISAVFTKSFGKKLTKEEIKKLEPPNYFMSIRINNSQITDLIKECQKEIANTCPDIKRTLIKVKKLHVTLFAMHLKDKNHVNLISQKLIDHKEQIFADFKENLPITFEGLSTFRNQVVYVDLVKNEYYNQLISLQKKLVKNFENWGINLYEKEFTPHLTLMKLSKARSIRKQGIKKIDKNIYKHMMNNHFGIEQVDMVHLCNMFENQSDGFYKIEGSIEFQKQTESKDN